MKKFLFASAAALAMIATSCSSEEGPVVSSDATSTFTVSLPGANFASRSFGDGYSATDIQYAVYDAETEGLITRGTEYFDEEEGLSTQVDLILANGRNYKIVFFAKRHEEKFTFYWFDVKNKCIEIDYEAQKMTDFDTNEDYVAYNKLDMDAFLGVYETGVVEGPIKDNVPLKRFMAQVNWGTNDLFNETVVTDEMYGEGSSNLVTKVEYKNVYNKYDVFKGEVIGEPVNATFDYAARPNEDFPGDYRSYDYISVNYILVPATSTLVEATLSPNNGTKDFTSTTVTNLPVQANYFTNICGALLTSQVDLTITKEPNTSTSTVEGVHTGTNDAQNMDEDEDENY